MKQEAERDGRDGGREAEREGRAGRHKETATTDRTNSILRGQPRISPPLPWLFLSAPLSLSLSNVKQPTVEQLITQVP